MASFTKQTKAIRLNKKKKSGQARKKKLQAQGSTPKFDIHADGKPAAK
jgi:hypothetical protein